MSQYTSWTVDSPDLDSSKEQPCTPQQLKNPQLDSTTAVDDTYANKTKSISV